LPQAHRALRHGYVVDPILIAFVQNNAVLPAVGRRTRLIIFDPVEIHDTSEIGKRAAAKKFLVYCHECIDAWEGRGM